MNNTFLLIKTNIMNSFGINDFINERNKGEKIKKLAILLVILWAAVVTIGVSFKYFFMISIPLMMINELNMLIVLGFLLCSISTLVVTIIKAPGYLFSFKDYDMLMALPVKISDILISKITLIYITNLIGVVIFGMPAIVVYGIQAFKGPGYYILAIVMLLFVQLIPMCIGSAIAIILGKISIKSKASNIILSLGSFAIIIAWIVGINSMKKITTLQLTNIAAVFDSITNLYIMCKVFLNALQNINIIESLLFILINIVIMAIFSIVFARSFKDINGAMKENSKAVKYDIARLKSSSVLKALYKKELNFYFSSLAYFLNTGVSIVILTFAAFSIVIFGEKTVLSVMKISSMSEQIVPIIMVISAFCIGFTFVTAPAISLEGKNLYILKVLPIKYVDIIKSKVLLSLTVVLPLFILDMTIVVVALKIKLLQYVGMIMAGTLFSVLSAITGIVVNLLFPKLNWNSQTVVVKQSTSVMVTMLCNAIYMAVMIGGYYIFQIRDCTIYLFVLSALLVILNLILWKVLKVKGEKLFLNIME